MNQAASTSEPMLWTAEDLEGLAMASVPEAKLISRDGSRTSHVGLPVDSFADRQRAHAASLHDARGQQNRGILKESGTHPGLPPYRAVLQSIIGVARSKQRPLALFTAGMASHFGTILKDLHHHIERLEQQFRPDDAANKHLASSVSALQQTRKLMHHLLALTNPEDAREPYEARPRRLLSLLFPQPMYRYLLKSGTPIPLSKVSDILKLLSNSMALQIQKALQEIHQGIEAAVQGFENDRAVCRCVKNIHKVLREAIHQCDHLTVYGGCSPLSLEPVQIGFLVQDSIETYRFCFHGRPIAVECDGALPPILGDRRLLQKLFLELISNEDGSLSPTYRIRKITIRRYPDSSDSDATGNRKEGIAVEVEFAGSITSQQPLSVWRYPFFTSPNIPRPHRVGLAAALSIVEQHGGRMQLTDTPQGALLRIVLPNSAPLRNRRSAKSRPAYNTCLETAPRALKAAG